MFLLLHPFVNKAQKAARSIHSISTKPSFAEFHLHRIVETLQYCKILWLTMVTNSTFLQEFGTTDLEKIVMKWSLHEIWMKKMKCSNKFFSE